MFELTAQQYDAVYASKDYEREAHLIRDAIRGVHPGLHTVLDVACGTGSHDQYLSRYFQVDGIDLEPSYLEVARQRNAGGRYSCGDMQDFSLDRMYDVIVCLFSSIGYVKTIEGLQATLKCFRDHLTHGGIALIEPWITPEDWELNSIRCNTEKRQSTTVLRMCHSTATGRLSRLTCEYLFGDPDGIVHVRDLHEMGLFTRQEMTRAMTGAGFDVEFDPQGLGRGLYTGRLATQPGNGKE